MTLTEAGNPYTGSPTIESGATLKAEPGVKFLVSSLTVKGTLIADGTSEAPVVFAASTESTCCHWGGILFKAGSGLSVIDHAEIRYGGQSTNSGAIEITEGASPTITNSLIICSITRRC